MFIGLDVRKATIAVAVAQGERGGEARRWGTIRHRADPVRRLAETPARSGRRLQVRSGAGPCGYGLHRRIVEPGRDCKAVAPSLLPVNAGDRVKTGRRDGIMRLSGTGRAN